MPYSSVFPRDRFVLILMASVIGHVLLIGYTKGAIPRSQFSVEQAPNTISIAIIKTQPKPEVKKPVKEKIITVQEKSVPEETVPEPVEKVIEPPEEIVEQTVLSQESRGAVHEAKPLEHINPAPHYPGMARRRGWEGTVRIKVWVNAGGSVDRVTIQESSGYAALDRAALQTVSEWRFQPAQRNARSVSSEIVVPVEFRLIH